ncbi:YesL family protein [Alkalihalobacterium bogoriense]|uniref:YesL family protein n=1 Tax=Alkalihalobacterium bogoriense TaxID=246272 RepID=UPI000479E116|nr:YesL family protein [Alkalihalobacterium bogoriense]
MERQGVMGSFYQISEWVTRFAYLNLLWIFFTVVGLVFWGIMPASVAMLTVIRKWLKGDKEIPIGKLFRTTYKKEFVKANALALLLFVSAYILFINFQLLVQFTGVLHSIFFLFLVMATCAYILMLFFIIPVYVHYDLPFYQYIRQAFLISLLSPLVVMVMVIMLLSAYYLFMFIPGLIPLFGASTVGFILMGVAFYGFKHLEVKRKGSEISYE